MAAVRANRRPGGLTAVTFESQRLWRGAFESFLSWQLAFNTTRIVIKERLFPFFDVNGAVVRISPRSAHPASALLSIATSL